MVDSSAIEQLRFQSLPVYECNLLRKSQLLQFQYFYLSAFLYFVPLYFVFLARPPSTSCTHWSPPYFTSFNNNNSFENANYTLHLRSFNNNTFFENTNKTLYFRAILHPNMCHDCRSFAMKKRLRTQGKTKQCSTTKQKIF